MLQSAKLAAGRFFPRLHDFDLGDYNPGLSPPWQSAAKPGSLGTYCSGARAAGGARTHSRAGTLHTPRHTRRWREEAVTHTAASKGSCRTSKHNLPRALQRKGSLRDSGFRMSADSRGTVESASPSLPPTPDSSQRPPEGRILVLSLGG